MKKWFTLAVMALMAVGANAQELTVSDKQKSGCLGMTRSSEDEPVSIERIPTIILQKEGNILSVELQNYTSNCATSDFEVKPTIIESSEGSPCTLSVNVVPVAGEILANCICTFNVSFTVRDLEVNSFYLKCWWYEGLVELSDGKSLVLKEREDYESLLSESKVWTMSYHGVVNPEVYGDIYHFTDTKLVGDTVINNIHFMRKYQRQWSLGEETPADWTATNEYLGQEGGKIYRYSDRTQNVVLDMDVSLNVGDRIGFVDELGYELPSFFVATAVSDTILTGADDNKPRRCVEVQLEAPQVADMWIEGIGSVTLGITGMEWFLASGAIPKLYKCTDGDAVIYQSTLSPGFYHPLVVRGGKKWTYRHNTFENVYDYYYILEGDTVIAGKNCLKMSKRSTFIPISQRR